MVATKFSKKTTKPVTPTCVNPKTYEFDMNLPVVQAKTGFEFWIEASDIANATCLDPTKCVIARAFKRAFGDFFREIHVGSDITKIVMSDKVVVYRTSGTLSHALRVFDATGVWHLPVGPYRLGATRPSRHAKRKTRLGRAATGGVSSVFKAKASATRRVIPAHVLAKAGS